MILAVICLVVIVVVVFLKLNPRTMLRMKCHNVIKCRAWGDFEGKEKRLIYPLWEKAKGHPLETGGEFPPYYLFYEHKGYVLYTS